MKKGLLIVLSLLLVTGIHAQIKYELGARAGLNLSTQTTKGAATNVVSELKEGVHAGAYGTFFFFEKLAAQLEIIWSQKGSKWSDPYFAGKDNLSYIDIPVLIRFQVLDRVNVHAGPQFSFMTGAKQIPDGEDAIDATGYYKNSDFGVLVGAELNLYRKLSIAIKFVEGFSVTTEPSYYIDQWMNRVIQVSLSYALLSN